MRKEAGFTLVEALATMGLCTLALLTLVGALHYTLNLNTYSKDRLIAMNDARRVAEQVRNAADVSLSSVATTSYTGFLSNALASESISVTASGTDPLTVTITINWVEKNRNESFQFVTKVTKR